MKNYFIGDLHFNHAYVIEHDGRPHSSVEEMNADMVNRWNARVSDNDRVFVIGDLGLCTSIAQADAVAEWVHLLHGELVLVRGNHDIILSPALRKCFSEVHDILNRTVEDQKLCMCHYPILCYWHQWHGAYHIYAHVHNAYTPYAIPGSVCVSACRSYIDYTPRMLEELEPHIWRCRS